MEPSGEETHPSDAADTAVGSRGLEASLDDVFGSTEHAHASHPSDMGRLQSEHATAGYREAVSAAKAATIQEGFDEGFSLGAAVGLRMGRLLGMLEGIADAVKQRGGDDAAAAAAVPGLLADARGDLCAGRVFGPAYWAPDGIWTFDVEPASPGDVLFADVADAHPLICKWTKLVDEQIRLWRIDEAILAADAGPRLDPLVDEAPVLGAPSVTPKRPLDW